MKKIFFYCLFLLINISNAQNQEVEKTVDAFFDAFHAKDTVRLKLVCADKMILQSIIEGKNRSLFTEETKQNFFKSLVSIPDKVNFKEKSIQTNIQIDGTMAHVWMTYEFYIDNQLQHCGVNSFQLYKKENAWQIVYLIDTRRKICI
jgi:hypothetical protein